MKTFLYLIAVYPLYFLSLNAALADISANNDSRTTSQDTAVVIDVLYNDTTDQTPLTIISNTSAAHGTVTIEAASALRYKPNQGFVGSDIFSYTIQNSAGEQDTALVQISIRASSDSVETASLAHALSNIASATLRNHRDSISQFLDTASAATLNQGPLTKGGKALGGSAGESGIVFGGTFLSLINQRGNQDPGSVENGQIHSGYDDELNGFTLGADLIWSSRWLAGIALGASRGGIRFDDELVDIEISDKSIIAFGSYRGANISTQLQLGHTELEYDYDSASNNGYAQFADIKGQYIYAYRHWRLVPAVSMNLQRKFMNSYVETAEGADMNNYKSYSSLKTRSITAILNFHIDRAVNLQWGVLVPRIAFSIERIMSAGQRGISGYSGDIFFEAPQTEVDKSQVTVDIGSSFIFKNGWSAYINQKTLLLLEGYTNNSLHLGVRKGF